MWCDAIKVFNEEYPVHWNSSLSLNAGLETDCNTFVYESEQQQMFDFASNTLEFDVEKIHWNVNYDKV